MPRTSLALAVGLVFFLTGLPASAQATKKSARPASNCAGGWTGVVTYTRTQSTSDSKTTQRVSGRGTDTWNWEMNYDYKATVGVLESPEKDGSSIGKAAISHSFTSKETTVSVEKNSCDRGKTWQEMTGTFTSDTAVTGQGQEDARVHVGVNTDGTYTVSVGMPQIQGTLSGAQSSTFSGQCKPKPGKNLNMEPSPTTIDGNSLTSDGSHRVDPNDANRLSGSYSLPLPGGGAETISWNLQRCAAELRLIDLKFEDMKFPKWDDWREISEQVGTVDGNWVRIKATVFNASGETRLAEVNLKETYKGDRWDGARPDLPLDNQTFTLTLEPGEEREIEMIWVTNGYAWYDDGRPRQVQRIKAELWEKSTKVDEMTRNLKVVPKPVVVVPGLWTSYPDPLFQNILTTAHSYGWKACPMADTSGHGTIQVEAATTPTSGSGSVYTLADNLSTYVDGIRASLNAWHVDMLGHSTGGLVARLYVHKQMEVLPDGFPVVKHLMLMATPNNGLACTDSLLYRSAFEKNPQAKEELKPESMAMFNQHVTQRKGTKFSALVSDAIPTLCDGPNWGDGVVPLDSAKHGIEDVTTTDGLHQDMISTENYTNYVQQHIVVGPRGTYPFAAKSAQ